MVAENSTDAASIIQILEMASAADLSAAVGYSPVTNICPPKLEWFAYDAPSPPPPIEPSSPPDAPPEVASSSCPSANWLPTVRIHSSSSTGFGSYPSITASATFSELYDNPRASSMQVAAILFPTGGLVSTSGSGGIGQLPMSSFSQPSRPAQSHSLLVQTPHVHTSLRILAVIVQCYDAHGDSLVSQASLTLTVSLAGAPSFTLTSYGMRGPSGAAHSRRYSATVPASWFAAAAMAGSTATVSSTLAGFDSNLATLTVYGTPSPFSSRLSSAGIAAYFTSDQAGTMAAETMRAGDFFYVQLYAHTGGYGLTSFEVKMVEDTAVCELVPSAGSFTASYTGALQGDLSGAYQTELLNRLADPSGSGYFTKYSRFQKLSALTSEHGHLGYMRMKMVGTGSCLTSAAITTFFYGGTTAYIPGVSTDDPVSLYGNTIQAYTDATVGVVGQLNANSPIVQMAPFSGSDVTVGVRAILFSSPDFLSVSSTSVVLDSDQAAGQVLSSVSAGGHTHSFNFSTVRPAAPQLQVDDALLQALPGSCGGFQKTRLYASSAGVDISRLLTFSSTDTSVASIDMSLPGNPVVVGIGVGTALIFVRDAAYANVSVAVSATQVAVSNIDAGVVTGVQWASTPTVAGPFAAYASHTFSSEDSRGWLYAEAAFDDGERVA